MALTDLSKIKHVVVLTMENRSFDHMLGALALDPQYPARASVDGVDKAVAQSSSSGSVTARHLAGQRARTFTPDPPHDSASVAMSLSGDGGPPMSGFVRAFEVAHGGSDAAPDVASYLTRAELPTTYALADAFTVCQRWFAPIPTQTIPNRLYMVAGHSNGLRDNPSAKEYAVGFSIETIFDQLNRQDWKVYSGSLPLAMLVKNLRDDLMLHGRLARLGQFQHEARIGALPRLSWIEPVYSWADAPVLDALFPDPNDDHPPSVMGNGEKLLAWVYETLRTSSAWESCLLVVYFDEHGGFADHVVPPAITDQESAIPPDGFTQRGVRVPALIVSPFAAPALVGAPNDVYDHCSLLKFLCDWFGIQPFAPRIASPRIKSVAELLQDQPRQNVPSLTRQMPTFATPPAVEAMVSAKARAARAPRPRLHDHDLAEIIENTRLVVEKQYGGAYQALFPELAGVPPAAKR